MAGWDTASAVPQEKTHGRPKTGKGGGSVEQVIPRQFRSRDLDACRKQSAKYRLGEVGGLGPAIPSLALVPPLLV